MSTSYDASKPGDNPDPEKLKDSDLPCCDCATCRREEASKLDDMIIGRMEDVLGFRRHRIAHALLRLLLEMEAK
jgi:hypothetical protein